MKFNTHYIDNIKITELEGEEIAIRHNEDGLDLLGDAYYQGFDRIIIHEKSITPDFFDLKNGMAGEILQKFSNYRVRLSIVGDFSKYASKPLHAFIYESNRGRQISFVNSVSEALAILSKPNFL